MKDNNLNTQNSNTNNNESISNEKLIQIATNILVKYKKAFEELGK